MPIFQKRSLVAGVLPTTASLLAGELGINVPDGRVFLRKSGSGSDTIQSAITTGAQNSGSVVLSGSLTLQSSSGSVLSVASDTLEFNGDRMELTGSFGVSGSMNLTGSLSVASDTLEFNGDLMEFTGSFVNSGSLRVVGTSAFTGSVAVSGSMVVSGSLTVAGNIFGSVATASLAFTASSADSFAVRGSLTSSLLFVTGSSRHGSLSTDSHNFTGSLSVINPATTSGENAVFTRNIATANTYSHIKIGSPAYSAYFGILLQSFDVAYMSAVDNPTTGNGIYVRTNGNTGFGWISPTVRLDVSGSSRFGVSQTDTHAVTGSFSVSGSVNVLNNEFTVQPTGVKLGNITTDAHTVTGSFSVSGSINIDGGTY